MAGFDWLLLDAEHAPNDVLSLIPQLMALKDSPSAPVVRPPWNDTVLTKRLLDAGFFNFLIAQHPLAAAGGAAGAGDGGQVTGPGSLTSAVVADALSRRHQVDADLRRRQRVDLLQAVVAAHQVGAAAGKRLRRQAPAPDHQNHAAVIAGRPGCPVGAAKW